MREIKFRAWDKKSKKIREVSDVVFWSTINIEKKDGSIKLVNLIGKDIINNKTILIQREEQDMILMQSTGLLDKEGKEIYYSDIIQHQQFYYEVVYNHHKIGFKCIKHITEDFSDLKDGGKCIRKLYGKIDDYENLFNIEKIKIIGNIYQDKNLITN